MLGMGMSYEDCKPFGHRYLLIADLRSVFASVRLMKTMLLVSVDWISI